MPFESAFHYTAPCCMLLKNKMGYKMAPFVIDDDLLQFTETISIMGNVFCSLYWSEASKMGVDGQKYVERSIVLGSLGR